MPPPPPFFEIFVNGETSIDAANCQESSKIAGLCRTPPPPVGETTPQVAIPGPTSRRWGEVPHRRLGMAAWTHLANGEGICLPLHGLEAEK